MPKSKTVFYVNKVEDIPKVEHWAIFRNSSVYVPGEGEWAPGHGYPAHNENFVAYEAYTDKDEFEAAISRDHEAYGRRPAFFIAHVKPLTVKTTVTTEVLEASHGA